MYQFFAKIFESTIWYVKDHFGFFAKLGGISVVDQIVVSGARFLATLLIGRYCGPEELGLYSLGFSILILFIVVQDALISTPFTVLIDGEKKVDSKIYAGSVLTHHAVLVCVSVLFLSGLAAYLSIFEPETKLLPILWALVCISPFALLREFVRRYFFAHIRLRAALVMDILVAAIQLMALLALAQSSHLNAQLAYVVVGLSCGLVAVSWLYKGWKNFEFELEPAKLFARRHWRFGKWLLGGQVVSVITQWSSYWLLALILSTTETGVFSACMNIVLLSNPLMLGMGNILDPRLSRAFNNGGCLELTRVVTKVSVIMGGVLGLFFIFLLVFGDALVELLYNNVAYSGNSHMISVLAFSVVFTAFSMAASMGLRPLQRTDLAFAMKILDLIILLAVIIPLISHWGMLGGAYAILLSSVLGCISRVFMFRYTVNRYDSAAA